MLPKEEHRFLLLCAYSIKNIDGLKVLGNPSCCIVAFTSDKFNILTLADKMRDDGWLLSCLQHPTW